MGRGSSGLSSGGTPVKPSGETLSFKSQNDADKYFSQYGWENSLTDEEKFGVNRYTGQWYSHGNKDLREGNKMSGEDANIVKWIDSAIAKSELKDDIVVTRASSASLLGLSENFTKSDVKKANLVGAIVQDKAYISTSANPSNLSGKVQYNIKVKKGKGVGAYVAPLSKFESESEFLLPRGTKFKINGVKMRLGKLTVDMEVM